MVNDLDYKYIEFPVSKKDFGKNENFACPVYVSD